MNIIQDEEPTSDSKERDNVSNGTKVLTYTPCFLSTVVNAFVALTQKIKSNWRTVNKFYRFCTFFFLEG